MNLANNTILITGGASGIGFALAKRYAHAGSQVIVCGRRQEQLDHAIRQIPGLKAIKADVASEKDRDALFQHASREYPDLNVLINNAGVQNHLPPLAEAQPWAPYRQEIAINVEAPIHLSMLFIKHLATRKNPRAFTTSASRSMLMPTTPWPASPRATSSSGTSSPRWAASRRGSSSTRRSSG